MPDRVEIRLAEYESVSLDLDHLSQADLTRLHALQDRRRCTLTPHRTGWTLTARATVGILALDRIRLVIAPKLAFTGDSLLQWFCYATAAPAPHPATLRNWQVDRHGVPDIVAAALLHECRALLRDGLRRDYIRHDTVEPVLRGRLDTVAQATKQYGLLDRLHNRTFDRDITIWENQLCGLALRAARTMVADPHLARDLARTATEFPAAASRAGILRALDRITYTRLNRHYRPAHIWAGLILRGGGVTDLLVDTGASAENLLLDMPALWESVVRRLVHDAAPPGTEIIASSGPTAITVRGDLSSRPPFRPDVLVRCATGTGPPTLFPIDAKYKTYANRTISAADVHQLLTYISGYAPHPAPLAAIIYPHPNDSPHRKLQISGNGRHLGTIRIHGVDTAATPEQAAAALGGALFT
ncbi:McrC family protein [Nocardia sp. NPDC058499]|uniref:McrC family protein n=1 Tax=Nocardia sp. NPDC058499 TaxID=3346530 RepID=UPI00365F9A15